MRYAIFLSMALFVVALLTVDAVSNESKRVSVLVTTKAPPVSVSTKARSILVSTKEPIVVRQDAVEPPVPAEPAAPIDPIQDAPPVDAPVADNPVLDGPVAPYEAQRIPTPSMSVQESMMLSPAPIVDPCCNTCCQVDCCCPTTANFCLIDPDGCPVEFCARVPACCAGQQPRVSWRCGLFGRKIATLCWDCCPGSVRVIVTRFGRVIVRD